MDNLDFKQMPNDINSEEAFLGCMLYDEEGLNEGVNLLKEEDFYKESHRLLFSAMTQLHNNNDLVDTITVSNLLTTMQVYDKIGGDDFIFNICNTVFTSANIKSYSAIIEEKSILRRLIRFSRNIEEICYKGEDEINNILEIAQEDIFNIVENKSSEDFTHIEPILLESLDKVQKLSKSGDAFTGIRTGFADFDKKTAGLQKSDLILIAARPSMGKTAFVLNIAQQVAESGKSVAVFSLEMAKDQLVNRMLCSKAMVDSNKFRTGKLESEDWEKLAVNMQSLSTSPIYIDDTPGISVAELRSKCRKLKMEKGIDLIIIDYLQLMSGTGRNESRQQEVSNISRALKAVAREMEAPVVALSQLSRANEKRIDKRPMLSDLRDSGAIEQDADLVIFIHREAYYDPEVEEKDLAEIIIAKQRNGETGPVKMRWLGQYTRFVDNEIVYS